MGASARKTGHGLVAIGDRREADDEFNAALIAYWRATIYFAGAEVFGEDGQDEATDRPLGDEVRVAVENMFGAKADDMGDEAEMVEFFRNFIAAGGAIERDLNEGELRDRVRFVIGVLIEERAGATTG